MAPWPATFSHHVFLVEYFADNPGRGAAKIGPSNFNVLSIFLSGDNVIAVIFVPKG